MDADVEDESDELVLLMLLTIDGKVAILVRVEGDEDKSTNELCLKSLSQK